MSHLSLYVFLHTLAEMFHIQAFTGCISLKLWLMLSFWSLDTKSGLILKMKRRFFKVVSNFDPFKFIVFARTLTSAPTKYFSFFEVLLLRFTSAQRFSSTSIKIDDCFLLQSFSIRFWGEFVLSKKSYKNPEERSI